MNRTPPTEIRRILRQEVGFGCPVPGCANPYLEYHHFAPPWHVQEHHNPEGMVALCAEHHKKADVKTFEDEQIIKFKQKGADGEVKGRFDWLRNRLLAIVGGFHYETLGIIESRRFGKLIWFERDVDGNLLLNIKRVTEDGIVQTIIENNDWFSIGDPYDIESPPSGKKLIIRFSNGDVIKVEFMEIESVEHIAKLYPRMKRESFSGMIFPITAVQVDYKTLNGFINIQSDAMTIGNIRSIGFITSYCGCAVQIS